jgi:branched-chain amino acid transport system substrate-binding protein
MSQKNETPILIVSLLLTLGVLGLGGWWFLQQSELLTSGNGGGTTPADPTTVPAPTSPGGYQISSGDRLLFPEAASPEKQQAIEAIATGNYAQAVTSLQAALSANRNDPEALIYLNNARIGDQPAYTLAVAVPASSAPDAALEILRGAAQAQNEINAAGGIQGTPLKILIGDDANDIETAENLAQALVDQREVLGVVGHFSSDTSLVASTIYQQAGLVMVSPTSTSVALSAAGDHIFRTVQSDRIAADGLARYMLEQMGAQTVAVFYNSESDYSRSLKDAFSSAVLTGGGNVVAEIDLKAPNFNPFEDVNQAIQRGADALMLAANTPTRPQAFQVISANRGQLQLLGGDSLYNAEILQTVGADAVGMVIAAPWNRDANPDSTFPAAARQLWGGDVSWRTALAYDAVLALAAGLQENATRSGVQQALSASAFTTSGASGIVQFLPSGDRNRAAQLVLIEQGPVSGYGYDFVPVP